MAHVSKAGAKSVSLRMPQWAFLSPYLLAVPVKYQNVVRLLSSGFGLGIFLCSVGCVGGSASPRCGELGQMGTQGVLGAVAVEEAVLSTLHKASKLFE